VRFTTISITDYQKKLFAKGQKGNEAHNHAQVKRIQCRLLLHNMPFRDVLLPHKVFIRLKGKKGVIYLLRCPISSLNYSKKCISISKVRDTECNQLINYHLENINLR
jgi:hypothetical protein